MAPAATDALSTYPNSPNSMRLLAPAETFRLFGSKILERRQERARGTARRVVYSAAHLGAFSTSAHLQAPWALRRVIALADRRVGQSMRPRRAWRAATGGGPLTVGDYVVTVDVTGEKLTKNGRSRRGCRTGGSGADQAAVVQPQEEL